MVLYFFNVKIQPNLDWKFRSTEGSGTKAQVKMHWKEFSTIPPPQAVCTTSMDNHRQSRQNVKFSHCLSRVFSQNLQ